MRIYSGAMDDDEDNVEDGGIGKERKELFSYWCRRHVICIVIPYICTFYSFRNWIKVAGNKNT